MGGTTVDRNFHLFLKNKFGPAFTELPLKKIASGSPLMNSFEGIKRDFKGKKKGDKVFPVPLKMRKLDPGDKVLAEFYDFEEETVRISR